MGNELKFFQLLRDRGWSEIQKEVKYQKGAWKIVFDTSSYIEIETADNPYLTGYSAPDDYYAVSTVNNIELLCQLEDQRGLYRRALKQISDEAGHLTEAREIAKKALLQCRHNWLIKRDNNALVFCPICGLEADKKEIQQSLL